MSPRAVRARLAVLAALLPLVVLGAGPTAPADAAWAATGSGGARAVAAVMPTGPAPTVAYVVEVPAVSRRYTVTWATRTVGPAPGTRATGYVVQRSTGAGPVTVCTVTNLTADGPHTCSEVLLLTAIVGSPAYRVTATYQNWTAVPGAYTP